MNTETAELIERQKVANAAYSAAEAHSSRSGECEICNTNGCGIDSVNLICDCCQKDLPVLIKTAGSLHPLKELRQIYEACEANSEKCGDHGWWLNRFIMEIDKLLKEGGH